MNCTGYAACLALAVFAGAASAQTDGVAPQPRQDPLWEIRAGGTALYGPVYPGASENKVNGVGAPLIIYRGERIRFGEYGVARAIAAESKKLELDVSLDAVYAARDAKARTGMPDLDYLFQVGPQVVWHITDTGWTSNGRSELTAFLPVRGVAASDFKSIEHVGWLAEPAIAYHRVYPGDLRTTWTAKVFASFADEGLMDYWYGVNPAFATVLRPTYEAKGGYLSTALNLSWSRELTKDFQVYITYQGRLLSGSANERSPLMQEDFTNAISFSFVWKILKSKRPARTDSIY
jgi:outer membrane scaffolding protein for murein synthesis (MipA/OmpV family)